MKNLLITVIAIVVLVGIFVIGSYIEPEIVEEENAATPLTEKRLPEFESFAVKSIYEGEIKAPNFAYPVNARPFRSVITESAKEAGVNFAGHYSVVNWGCGTSCQNYAIIDAVTGAIVEYGFSGSYGARFVPWSRLLIINPPENLLLESEDGADISYYALNQENDLIFLGKKYFKTGEIMCSRAVEAVALELQGNRSSNMNTCVVPDGFVVTDLEKNKSVNFSKEGNITKNEEGDLAIVYEEPGSPALTLDLIFNGASECFKVLEGKIQCDKESFVGGERVYVEGFQSGESLTVWVLEVR